MARYGMPEEITLSERMKTYYENRYRFKLSRRIPVIMRLDGKAFHTYTARFPKPFSVEIRQGMLEAAKSLLTDVQGARMAFTQFDEITLFIEDYNKIDTQAWFDYNIQKMTSVSASMASVVFNKIIFEMAMDGKIILPSNMALFDSRVFNVPKEEVLNAFYERFLDCVRNSISAVAQSKFSHGQLVGKTQKDMLEMLSGTDTPWEEFSSVWKYGTFLFKNEREIVDLSIDMRETENRFKLSCILDPWIN